MDMEFDHGFSRPDRDTVLLAVVQEFARRGTCGRAQVGAAIAKDGRVLVTGYNGPPAGFEHCSAECLAANPNGCSRSVHAEANCIAYAARYGISVEGATIYCTHLPCRNCGELIINSGLSRVVYRKDYRGNEPKYNSKQLLKDAKIDIMHLP